VKSRDDDGIGTELDRFRWDYEPPVAERRFFLRPVGAFFGAFRWEGKEGQFPMPEDHGDRTPYDDD
jgi:hypothetical protein